MASQKKDPHIAALEAVHSALKPLDREARGKVLASVHALLEIPEMTPPSRETGLKTPPPPRGPTGPRVSIVELIQDKQPGTSAQRLTLYAYYREKYEASPRFARDDLKDYFQKSKEPPPGNYDRDFVEAVRKGWIHEEGDDSYITSKGIEAVEAGFPGERKRLKRAGRNSRLQATKSKKRRRKK